MWRRLFTPLADGQSWLDLLHAILHWILLGYKAPEIMALGFSEEEVELVRKRLDSTHWKRRLPTVAMLSATAIGEYYLRPVDY